jgi:hypothetical protein
MATPPSSSLSSPPDRKDFLTVSQAVAGLLAFSSKALPLLIYSTIPANNCPRQVIVIKDAVLSITASLYMIQAHMSLNSNVSIPNVSTIIESLVWSLTECVLLFSNIEASLGKIKVGDGRVVTALVKEMLGRVGGRKVVPRLEDLNTVLCLIADIMEWYCYVFPLLSRY